MLFSYQPNPCPFCGTRESTPYYSVSFPQGSVQWVQCTRDGLIYQDPRLDDQSISRLYNTREYVQGGRTPNALGYYDYFESEQARLVTGRRRIKQIEDRCGRKGLDILEIGCATGSLLKEARDRGHRVSGIDASAVFVEYARRVYDLSIETGFIEDTALPESAYDVVFAQGTLVCLANPIAVITKVRRLLRPAGLFIFNVPVLDSLPARVLGKKLWVYRPGALVLYTRPSVVDLLKRTGFRLAECRQDVQAVSLEKLATVLGLFSAGRWLGSLRRFYLTTPVPSVLEFIGARANTEHA